MKKIPICICVAFAVCLSLPAFAQTGSGDDGAPSSDLSGGTGIRSGSAAGVDPGGGTTGSGDSSSASGLQGRTGAGSTDTGITGLEGGTGTADTGTPGLESGTGADMTATDTGLGGVPNGTAGSGGDAPGRNGSSDTALGGGTGSLMDIGGENLRERLRDSGLEQGQSDELINEFMSRFDEDTSARYERQSQALAGIAGDRSLSHQQRMEALNSLFGESASPTAAGTIDNQGTAGDRTIAGSGNTTGQGAADWGNTTDDRNAVDRSNVTTR